MRVILATHRTNEWLGVNKYFYLLGKYLARLGAEVRVIVDSTRGCDAVREICGDSVDTITLGPTALGPISTARYCRNVANYLERHQDFDLLHCGHVLPFFYLGKKKRRLVVFQPFGNELFTLAGNGLNRWYCGMAQRVLRYCGEKADVLLAGGDFQLEEMHSYYPDARRLEVLPVGVEMKGRIGKGPRPVSVRGFQFLAVNSLLPYEGMDELIKAFAQVGGRKLLVIVGKGSEKNRLERLVRDLPIVFRQDLSELELRDLYDSSDAFVCTTHETDVQMGVLEAMAAGLPVLSRRSRWLPESVVQFDGISELASQMSWITLISATKRYEIGQKGIEQVRQYSFTGIAKKALEIYSEIKERG